MPRKKILKPDETFSAGPVTYARFKNIIMSKSILTEEEKIELRKQLWDSNKQVIDEINHKIAELRELLAGYDPLNLMCYAAATILPIKIKYNSEYEHSYDESFFQPALEYLQFLISITEPSLEVSKLEKESWQQLWDKALKIFQLTINYIFTKKFTESELGAIDELRVHNEFRRIWNSGDRYQYFFEDHLKISLSHLDQQILDAFGLPLETVISELCKILIYGSNCVLITNLEFAKAVAECQEELIAKGYSVNAKEDSEVEIERTRKALETEEFRETRKNVIEASSAYNSEEMFNIKSICNLPDDFLRLLSVTPGEASDHSLLPHDLSPMSNSTYFDKPFLKIDNQFYYFFHSGIVDHTSKIIEDFILSKYPKLIPRLVKRRASNQESNVLELFKSIFPDSDHFLNCYYRVPGDANNLTEVDILIVVDDLLFIIEVKTGSWSEPAKRGAPKSFNKDVSQLLLEAGSQCERVRRTASKSNTTSFFDHTGQKEILKISSSTIRKFVKVIVTQENLGWIGASLSKVYNTDNSKLGPLPWHISIDDLMIISHLFRNSGIQFCHFLEERMAAALNPSLFQADEIEHVGLYFKLNNYHESPVVSADRFRYDASYMLDIDEYFAGLGQIDKPKVPSQELPALLAEIIVSLNNSSVEHRFELGCLLLSFSKVTQNELEEGLKKLVNGAKNGGQLSLRMPIKESELGITISFAKDNLIAREHIRSEIQLNESNYSVWLVVQLKAHSPLKVSSIKKLSGQEFSLQEKEPERLRFHRRAMTAINENKPGRNDPCPCGSGKKYKKCHLLILKNQNYPSS